MTGETILLMKALNTSPVSAANVKTWTNHDKILSRVKQMIKDALILPAKLLNNGKAKAELKC